MLQNILLSLRWLITHDEQIHIDKNGSKVFCSSLCASFRSHPHSCRKCSLMIWTTACFVAATKLSCSIQHENMYKYIILYIVKLVSFLFLHQAESLFWWWKRDFHKKNILCANGSDLHASTPFTVFLYG